MVDPESERVNDIELEGLMMKYTGLHPQVTGDVSDLSLSERSTI